MVKVSVISPVYNVEKYLPSFIKSIENQKLKDYELILVDDGSTDDSLQICKNAANSDARIRVIHQKNQGSGVARNTGLKIAKGKYIYFCDPDDYIDRNLLYDNIYLAEKNDSSIVLFGYYAEVVEGRVLKCVVPNNGTYNSLSQFKKIFPILFEQNLIYYVWNKIYLHSSIKKLKFETSRTGQDFRFNIKYFSTPRKITCNSRAYYHYLTNRPNSAQNSVQLSKIRNKVYDLAEENQQLNNLFFYCWKEKSSKVYINLMIKRNMDVLLLALNSSEMLSIEDRKAYLNTLIEINSVNEFLNTYNFNSIKEKYIYILMKHRNNLKILWCDKYIRKIWRHLK